MPAEVSDADGETITSVPFFEFSGANDTSSQWPYRPVDVRVGKQGQLFVSSDASNQIIVIGHE